jgi:hypothetical protein
LIFEGAVMKTIKNHNLVFAALTIILLTFVLLACYSPMEVTIPPDEKYPDFTPGMGAIQLNFGNNGRQTIMPGVMLSELTYYVEISHTDGLLVVTIPGISFDEANEPIALAVGEYYVHVFASTGARPKSEAAFVGGGDQPIEVTLGGGITPADIQLKGNIESTVKGKFTYSLSSPVTVPDKYNTGSSTPAGGFTAYRSKMIITPYFSGKGTPRQEIDLTNTTFTTPKANPADEEGVYSDLVGVELLAGYYSVEIEWKKTNFADSGIRFILHIYPTLTSYLDYELPPLTRTTNASVYFDANGGIFTNNVPQASPAFVSGDRIRRVYIQSLGRIIEPAETPASTFGMKFTNTDLARTGYEFMGWHRMGAEEWIDWNFETDIVWENYMTLYAKWESISEPEDPEDPDKPIVSGDKDEDTYVFSLGKPGSHIHIATPPGAQSPIQWWIRKELVPETGEHWSGEIDAAGFRVLTERGSQFNMTNLRDYNPFLTWRTGIDQPGQDKYPMEIGPVYILRVSYTINGVFKTFEIKFRYEE